MIHWRGVNVPIAPSLGSLLKELKKTAASNFVFPGRDGGYWRIDIQKELVKIAKRAGIKDFTRIHDLRHTCAAQLRSNGVPLESIMGILRHADIRETLIYAPYSEAEGQEAIKRLEFI